MHEHKTDLATSERTEPAPLISGSRAGDTNLDDLTGSAPPYCHLLATEPNQRLADGPPLPRVGSVLGDFELLSQLGAGAFGQVYLAHQRSLGRVVALKVTANRGEEARTLARLEHEHIVQVYSEVVDEQRDLRLLCMQYVPGTTLQRVLEVLAKRPRESWSGRAILDIIDAVSTGAAALDPAALRDREFLGNCDFIEAICWLGARLAEALAHAHRQGVLHRDVKPANILLSRYGRPYLADFNVAALIRNDGSPQNFGGTLAYMAPEHLAAFAALVSADQDAVCEMADIYALGVVLYELLVGQLPFKEVAEPNTPSRLSRLEAYLAARRAGPPAIPVEARIPETVARLIQRCLEPQPAQRFTRADDLARALDGCRKLRRVGHDLPPSGLLTIWLQRWPFFVGCLLIVLPHLLGSVVNVSYNELRIVQRLRPEQEAYFVRFVMIYNAFAYPLCLLILAAVILPIRGVWQRLERSQLVDDDAVALARRRALRLPFWAVVVSALGWLPGGILFPLGLHYLTGPVNEDVFGHFLISFLVAGLIALTYSVLAIQYLVLRVLYPRLWLDTSQLRSTARTELQGLDQRLSLIQFLAVLIPLAGALLMIGVGPDTFQGADYQTYRLLVTALIGLGMLGLGVALVVTSRLRQTLTVLTGGTRR